MTGVGFPAACLGPDMAELVHVHLLLVQHDDAVEAQLFHSDGDVQVTPGPRL